MPRSRVVTLALLLVWGADTPAAFAQPDTQLQRAREQLRQTATELRRLQADNARLQTELAAAQQAAASAAENAAAAEQLVTTSAERDALRAEAGALQSEREQLRASLAQWQASHAEAVALARTRDAEARRFEGLWREVDTHVDACEKNNLSLIGISEELIARYKGKGVWEAARRSEPLTGIGRVELERIAQEYHGRVVDAQTDALDPASRPAGVDAAPEATP
jgi:chromosome segregation ATPase